MLLGRLGCESRFHSLGASEYGSRDGICGLRHRSARRQAARAVCMRSLSDDVGETSSLNELSSEFARHVNTAGISFPSNNRKPSPLISPIQVVEAQMEALQLNDWPEEDAGVEVAFLFSKPLQCEQLIIGQVFSVNARSWSAQEEWLTREEFSKRLHSLPFCVLLNCEKWSVASLPVFHTNFKGEFVSLAVHVVPQIPARGAGTTSTSYQGAGVESAARYPEFASKECGRTHTLTFVLELIGAGAYKGCWLTVGVRSGDLANR